MIMDLPQSLANAATRRMAGLACLVLLFACASGCHHDAAPPPAPATAANATASAPKSPANDAETEPWFVDQTAAAGIQFRHDRGPMRHWIPEITCGGAAWFDYDHDGWIDLYLVQGGDLQAPPTAQQPHNVLYRNLGNGTFADVTERAGVGDTHYGMGAAVGDYDLDGDLDLYVTNVGPNVLYRNRGDGTFEDVTDQAGVGYAGWSTAAAFVDYDQDGDVDLYVVNYLRWSPETEIDCRTGDNQPDYCTPNAYHAPAMDVLYRNRGDGTFEDVTEAAGLSAAYGNGLGLAVADLNADGRLDFYVANDGNPNQLWTQDAPGHFKNDALRLGCAVDQNGTPEAGMGVAIIDIENDGDLDLFMTNLTKETNTLYVRQQGYYEDQTTKFKLAAPSVNYTGFGLGFVDFDNDRLLDLYVANGRVARYGEPLVPDDLFAEPNQLLRGVPQGFEEVRPQGGTRPVLIENSRAAAFADYDRDGDVDTLVVNNAGPARLLQNQVGQRHHWLRLRVLDRHGADAVGALVGVRHGNATQWRVVGRCYGFLASQEPELHFGLGELTQVDGVRVVWPGGQVQEFERLEANRTHELRQR